MKIHFITCFYLIYSHCSGCMVNTAVLPNFSTVGQIKSPGALFGMSLQPQSPRDS